MRKEQRENVVKKSLLAKCGDSERPAIFVVQNGANSNIPPPSVRGPTWQDVRTRLVEAFQLLEVDPADDTGEHQVIGVDPDFDYGPTLMAKRERESERTAIFKSAKAEVEARPGIFADWCKSAEARAQADEAIRLLQEPAS